MARGVTNTQKQTWLEGLLSGTLYVALLTALPDEDGSGASEVAYSGYARQSLASWVTLTDGATVTRANNATVTFPAADGIVQVIGWAIYSASSGGTLKAFGAVRDVGGTVVAVGLSTGEQPQFLTQELKVSLA